MKGRENVDVPVKVPVEITPLFVAAFATSLSIASAHAAQLNVVLTTVPGSPVSTLPNAADGPLTGNFAPTTSTPFGAINLSTDGTQFVLGVFTDRTATGTTNSNTNTVDNAYIRGTGLTATQTIARSGQNASYTGNPSAIELDITANSGTTPSLTASITNAGAVLYRANTSEIVSGSTQKNYQVYVAPDGTKTAVSAGGAALVPQPSGGPGNLVFTNAPGSSRPLDSGFVYFNGLNRGTSSASDAGLFRYDAGAPTYTNIALTNSAQPRFTDRAFGVSADGSNVLISGQYSSTSGTNSVVLNGTEIVRNGGTFLGETVISTSPTRGLMGPDGTYAIAGQFAAKPGQTSADSFLAVGEPGVPPVVIARSGDVVNGPVANERISAARKIGTLTTTNQGKLNNNFAIAPDGNVVYVAGTNIADLSQVNPEVTAVPNRDVLIHTTGGYLLGVGDPVMIPVVIGGVESLQQWYVSNLNLDTAALSNEYAYIGVSLRENATFNTASGTNTYATFSGASSFAVLAIAVPEPSVMGLAALGLPLMMRRRR